MRTKFLLIAATLALLVGLWQAPLSAQCGTNDGRTCMTRTTLSANVDNSQTTISVTSNTNFDADDQLWVDFEQMHVVSVSGTQIRVNRGVNGTAAQAHDNADAIWVGASNHFHTNDPDLGQDCTGGQGQAAYSPWINVRTGYVSICDNGVTADWTQTIPFRQTVGSIPTTF